MDPNPSDASASASSPLVEQGELNLAALSERLGPFAPPDNFDHGEEFAAVVPRPISSKLRRGSFASRRWSVVLTLFILGTGCIVLGPIPFVQKLSSHILPLRYLNWIGYGLIGLSVLLAIRNRLAKSRYQYVIEGMPLVGRVLGVFTPTRTVIDPQSKVATSFFRYLAAVEFQDPETRQMQRLGVLSEEEWDTKGQLQYDPGVDAGDYVTLVRMPNAGPDQIRLYGFLGLDPDREYITRNGQPLGGVSPFTAVLISLAVLLGLWFLILGLYVLECCMPREWNWKTSLPFLGAGAALGAIALGWLISREQGPQGGPKKSGISLAAFFGALLGAAGGAVSMGAINAAFDKSPPTYQPVVLTERVETTHNFMIRTYEVQYTQLNGGDSEKHGVSIDDYRKIEKAASSFGVLETRAGALGLPWISHIHPMIWLVYQDEFPDEDRAHAITVKPASDVEGGIAMTLVPRLVTAFMPEDGADGRNASEFSIPCPPDLAEAAISALKREVTSKGGTVERLAPKP